MTYGNVYVASVALGARDEHTLKVFLEAEAYEGPSLIIAYSHCIAHGIDIASGLQHQKSMVDAGQWLLYRFNPDNGGLQIDTRRITSKVEDFMKTENRFNGLTPEVVAAAQADVDARWKKYQHLAALKP
jgi:pyruvate-ferredoxin/flavodoxin oxidoreductase